MRVVFLTQWFDPEPGAFRGLPLAIELQRRGHDVEVITGFPNYPGGKIYPGYALRPWRREVVEAVSVVRVALYPSHGRSVLGRVANYASFALSAATIGNALVRRGDVTYVYHPPPTVGAAGAMVRAFGGGPLVYHIADMWPESVLESGMLGDGPVRRVASAALHAYCDWVYRQTHTITVLSPGFKRLLVERGVPPDKVEVVYNWADDRVFRPVPRDEALARELGMSGKLNFVYAGIYGVYQGLECVIRAAAKVRDISGLQVVLIGDGVRERELRRVAADAGATNVRFVPRRPMAEMPKLNALADVLLAHLRDLPFFRTTIPSKTQVALASGRPLLMGVAGDAADLVRQSGAGLVVPPDDVDAMAAAFRSYAEMPAERREEFGCAGHRFYVDNMSLSVGAARMVDIFERAVC